jgi:hypothetical protein
VLQRRVDLEIFRREPPCNLRKGSLTPAEAKMPFQPTVHHMHKNGRLFPPNYLHHSWVDYLYWDSELEP